MYGILRNTVSMCVCILVGETVLFPSCGSSSSCSSRSLVSFSTELEFLTLGPGKTIEHS